MKCPNCGKRVPRKERFCPTCGHYIEKKNEKAPVAENKKKEVLIEEKAPEKSLLDEIQETAEKEQPKEVKKKEEPKSPIPTKEEILDEFVQPEIIYSEEETFEEEDLPKKKKKPEELNEFDLKANSSGTKKTEFYYEHEDLLEAYIGEDYRLIKRHFFNIWAFLLNWMYFLYRKLYITGIIGLVVSWVVVVYFRPFLWYYLAFMMLLLGFGFNKYYIAVSKRKVEKIVDKEPDTDKFTLQNICQEKGGVNVVLALVIYFIFLLLIFFSLFSFNFNKNHNTKFWKENSENRANCTSIVKTASRTIEEEKKVGTIVEAVCRVTKDQKTEFEVYVKTETDNETIYSYYKTENSYLSFKTNTEGYNALQIKRANSSLTEAENIRYQEMKEVESSYQEIYNYSRAEDKLIATKKNKSEKVNYIFGKEEILR